MAVTEPGSVGNPSNDHPLRNWRIAGGMFASITLLLGAIGLAGWFFNEPLWRSIWKTGSEMKFNTALCLTLLGAAFLLSFSRRTFARKASAWGAMTVVLITSLTLLEYGLSLNFGIDELVFKDTNLLGTTFPGRMAGQSATTFIFLATGILLLRCESQRLRSAAQWIALVSLGFPTQAFMGYALGRMTVVGLGPESSYMAIPTAAAFIAGALALLLREPDQFLMASLTARTHASAVFRRLLVCASLLPLMLGWLALNVVGGDQQSPQFSVATMALITTFIFVGLMWYNAARLNTVTQALSKRDQLLRENEAMLRTVTNEAQVGLVMVNAERRYAFANQTYAEILRLPSTDIVGQRVADVLAQVYDQIRPRLDRAFAGERVSYELRLPAIPGKEHERFYEVIYEPRINAPEPYVVVVMTEITERKRADTALRNSEALYRTIGESINYGVWVCDADGRNTYASESFLKLVGLTQEQCSNFGWGEVLHPDDIKATAAAWQECVRTGGNWDMEHRFKGVDGQWHHILARGMPVKDADGKIHSWAGINLDITERKSAQRALFESTERFRLLTEVIEMQVWTANPTGELDYANQECIKYLAVDLERDVLGNAWAQFVHPDDLPETIKRWQASLTTGSHYEAEFRLRSENGDYRWFLVRAKALQDDAGRISRWLGTNTDIHALKTAQQKATQASRAKDDFLAALSHELRTPLNPALLIASESADNHQLPEEVRGNFEVILKSIELEARLIDDLLDLTRITSGKLTLNKTPVDVHAVLADALTTVRAEQQEKNIQLALKLAAETFWVNGDAVRLQQVFWNVLKNAVKFTPAGGRITVTTSRNASGQLAVSIADSGLGLSPDELGRVFSAFAQGDHAGGGGSHRFGGLGLGLAISKNLVELHAGGIRAESAGRDRGATFIIELPLTERKKESAPRAAAPANGSPADRSGIWILLVEDHEPTRAALVHLLVRRRYEVKPAASLAEARAFAAQHRFHLLISDIGLPDGNGFDLMTELRAGNPDLRGIALTGYGMEEDMARSRNAGFVSHLVKPVRVQAMEAALAAAIS